MMVGRSSPLLNTHKVATRGITEIHKSIVSRKFKAIRHLASLPIIQRSMVAEKDHPPWARQHARLAIAVVRVGGRQMFNLPSSLQFSTL